jgi:thymidine phosphorylase
MADQRDQGAAQIREVIRSGAAAERFGRMVAAMGGPADFVERWRDRLPSAPVVRDVVAQETGYITAMDGQILGMAVVHLGGGRLRAGDKVNPSVGLSDVALIGDPVQKGDPLAIIHATSEAEAQRAIDALGAAFTISDEAIDMPPLILKTIR